MARSGILHRTCCCRPVAQGGGGVSVSFITQDTRLCVTKDTELYSFSSSVSFITHGRASSIAPAAVVRRPPTLPPLGSTHPPTHTHTHTHALPPSLLEGAHTLPLSPSLPPFMSVCVRPSRPAETTSGPRAAAPGSGRWHLPPAARPARALFRRRGRGRRVDQLMLVWKKLSIVISI